MIENTTPLAQVALRVAILYLLLIVMVRITGKREVGQLAPLDLLAMLLLAETVSPGLTGQDTSVTASLAAAATLLLLTKAVGRLTRSSHRLERWIDGVPVVVARNGRPIEESLRREGITHQELESAVRKNNVEDLSQVRLAVVEPDGTISVGPVSSGGGATLSPSLEGRPPGAS